MEKSRFYDLTNLQRDKALRILSNYKETETLVKSFEGLMKKSMTTENVPGKELPLKNGKIIKDDSNPDDGMFKAGTDEQQAKTKKVMDEWKSGTLKGPDGKVITDRKQAIAVALSEAGLSKVEKSEAVEKIEKGGEGSRGGKVIGHTKSGKPIYSQANHDSHKNFNAEDHFNAMHVQGEFANSKKSLKDESWQKHKDEESEHYKHFKKEAGDKDSSIVYNKQSESIKHAKEQYKKHKESSSEKHKVGDHVVDKEGNKGKVTHADDKEVAVEHDNGDISGYGHHQVSKVKKDDDVKKSEMIQIMKAYDLLGVNCFIAK